MARTLTQFCGVAVKLVAACWLLVTASGCVSCPCSTWCCKLWVEPESPKTQVSTILTYWDNRVRFAPDTVNKDATLPGLVGRVLLVSEELENAQMLDADGTFVIDLFDLTAVANSAQPKMIERWEFDRQTLKRLKKKDGVGNGYTLFLPWASYRPEITQVKLQLSYIPAGGGGPIHADPMAVSLRSDEPIHIHNRNIVPVQHQVPAKN